MLTKATKKTHHKNSYLSKEETKLSSDSFAAIIPTPIGSLGIILSGDSVSEIRLFYEPIDEIVPKTNFAKNVVDDLSAYFKQPNQRFNFATLTKGTLFQKKVWETLCKIPVGETRSYSDLAKELNTHPRAIGGACRANPLLIVVPCHRVVAKTNLGGYSGKTTGTFLETKKWLLAHEKTSATN